MTKHTVVPRTDCRSLFIATLVLSVFSSVVPAEENCHQSPNAKSVASCLAAELQGADQKINETYRALMASVNADQQSALRNEQRAWVKERDRQCHLADDQSSRGSWLKEIAADDRKVLCVARQTQERTGRLNQILADVQAKRSIQLPETRKPNALGDFLEISMVSRHAGKWYFEIAIDRRGIAKSQEGIAGNWPTTLWFGCAEAKTNYDFGSLVKILPGEQTAGTEVIGLALDLDRGKAYVRQNNVWQNGEPGGPQGKDIRQGRPYVCGVDSTVAMKPLLEKRLLSVNLGQRPFEYPLPKEYKPFQPEPIWMLSGVTDDRRVYFDYRQIQLDVGRPTAFVKEEFTVSRDSGDGLERHSSRIGELNIDCKTEQVTEKFLTLISASGRPVGYSDKLRDVDHRVGEDTVGGRLVKTYCFLREKGFSLPDPDLNEKWDEMQSPTSAVRIFEAIDQRQYKNGFLLVKQKNEMAASTDVFGKNSKTLIGITAFDCRDLSANQLIGVRFDEVGKAIAADFFISKQPIQLEKNRRRFFDACETLRVRNNAG